MSRSIENAAELQRSMQEDGEHPQEQPDECWGGEVLGQEARRDVATALLVLYADPEQAEPPYAYQHQQADEAAEEVLRVLGPHVADLLTQALSTRPSPVPTTLSDEEADRLVGMVGEDARRMIETILIANTEFEAEAADSLAELLPVIAALLTQARADTERRWKGNAEAIGRALDQAEDQLRRETRQLRERIDELATELDGARRATEMAAADRAQARTDGAAEERERIAAKIEAAPGSTTKRITTPCVQFDDEPDRCVPNCPGHPDTVTYLHGPAYFAAIARSTS